MFRPPPPVRATAREVVFTTLPKVKDPDKRLLGAIGLNEIANIMRDNNKPDLEEPAAHKRLALDTRPASQLG